MTTRLDLSVIVPCHNEAETLPAQLDALTAQSWAGSWEIVVVDNASTDRTAEIASGYVGGAVRVRVMSADEGRGVSYARNAGVRASTSRAVAFCDGDDVVGAGWVSAMGTALCHHELVTGPVEASVLNDDWLATTRPLGNSAGLPFFGAIPFARGNNSGMVRSLWEQLGGYRENFEGLEDIEFSIRAASVGVSPTLVGEALVSYRYRPALAGVWRQGIFYGRGRPALAVLAETLGLEGPRRTAGLKSWAWLFARIPTLLTRSGRSGWVWVLANRIGVLRGAAEREAGVAYLLV